MAEAYLYPNAHTRLTLNYNVEVHGVWGSTTDPLRAYIIYSFQFYCPSGSTSLYYNGMRFNFHSNSHIHNCNFYLTAGQWSPIYGPHSVSIPITDTDGDQAYAPGWGCSGYYNLSSIVHFSTTIPLPTIATFSSVSNIDSHSAILTSNWQNINRYWYYGFRNTITNKVYNIGYARDSQNINVTGLLPDTNYNFQIVIFKPNGAIHSYGNVGAGNFNTLPLASDVPVLKYKHNNYWTNGFSYIKNNNLWKYASGIYLKYNNYWLSSRGSPAYYKNYVTLSNSVNGWYEYISPITTRMSVEMDIWLPLGSTISSTMPFFGGRSAQESSDRCCIYTGLFLYGVIAQYKNPFSSNDFEKGVMLRIRYQNSKLYINDVLYHTLDSTVNVIPAVNAYFMSINTGNTILSNIARWPTGTRLYGARVADLNGVVLNSFIVDDDGNFNCLLSNTILEKKGSLTLVKGN